MVSQLDSLKKFSSVVADTGDIDSIQKFNPDDCTTNPSLIFKAVQSNKYKKLVDEVISNSKSRKFSQTEDQVNYIADQLTIAFGIELTKIVPGYVSTEVDSDLSFNTEATVEKAKQIINSYEQSGVPKNRILIKIAGTWEGIQAVKKLEAEGISCNCTLIFSLTQAIACAEAGAFLISPFVGRILDWFKSNTQKDYDSSNDPGVESVEKIFNYFKKFNYNTIVMAASFRNKDEIINLAGCDKLTISPTLLEELSQNDDEIKLKLSKENSSSLDIERINVNESSFRWHLNENQMASFKLAEGIRLFNKDLLKLKELIRGQL
ncbi:MAG: transaldolase [Pelagibacteraceae bacterium]|jgi:transaldolase|nr:MAG: transaldolase [Pelagibacteraceae bacterium]|tara:strand:- start:461 stop:1420 length:960 start_codon:yes stop_codon:yes gene_type:complete